MVWTVILLVAAPAVLAGWLLTGLLFLLSAAALTKASGATEPTGAAGLALAGSALLLGLLLHLFARSSPARRQHWPVFLRRPLTSLGLILLAFSLGAAVALLLDSSSVLGTVLATAASFGGAAYLQLLLAWLLVRALVALTRLLLRLGHSSEFRSGLLVGLGSPISLAALVAWGAVLLLGISAMSGTPSAPADSAAMQLTELASALPGVQSVKERSGGSLFDGWTGAASLSTAARKPMDECFERLSQEPPRPSEMQKAASYLSSWTSREDALDAASDAVIKVCARYSRAPLKDLVSYYHRAARNSLIDEHRRWRDRACPLPPEDCWNPDPTAQDLDADPLMRARIQAVFCRLSPQKQRCLQLSAQGYADREIAAELSVSPDNARQICSRARKELERGLEAMNCR